MYIGPWQEYKLAQVLKLKNDIYEAPTNQPARLNNETLSLHNQNLVLTNSYKESRSSSRSFSSDVQRPFPRFNVDTYYERWKKVEFLLAKSETSEIPKKPPIPSNINRKRKPQNIHKQRVQNMRALYGLDKEIKFPPINKPDLDTTATTDTRSKESRESPFSLPPIENRTQEKNLKTIKEDYFGAKVPEYLPPIQPRIEEIKIQEKKPVYKTEITPPTDVISQFSSILPPAAEISRFSSVHPHFGISPEIEDDLKSQVDGLLQWVEELPEEVSTGTPYSSTIKL
ncbi:unnamed protein product [Blepharisma stoltei]|uniref:Uncharacterized protein n=1 Tax=Blepharisma stoltei TaxID=1481888 RepID=A0AAU9J446_9CILI|nr:unnamed protein product [Blepharisma stoltei]